MSRKKHKKGTCPDCRSYGVTEKVEENLLRYTCVDCGFMYTLDPGARTDSDPDEKRPNTLF